MNKRQAFYKVCEYEEFLESKKAPKCPKKNKETLEKYLKRHEESEEDEESLKIERLLNNAEYMRAMWALNPAKNDWAIEEAIKQRIAIRKVEKYLFS